MPDAVVDSNVIVGARLKRNQWHERGKAIVGAIDAGTPSCPCDQLPPSRDTDTPIEKQSGDTPALATLEFRLESHGVEIVQPTHEDFTHGLAIYQRSDDIDKLARDL